MLKLGVAIAVGESRILDVNKTSLFDLQFENNRDKQIDYPKFQNMVIYSQKISMMYFDDCGLER